MSTLHYVKRVVVSKPVADGTQSTQIPNVGNRLYDFTTDAININPGYFWAYTPVADSGNPIVRTAATYVPGEELEIISRNNTAVQRAPLTQRTLEQTGKINPRSFCGVQIQINNARFGSNEMHLLEASFGVRAGNTQAFVPQDDFYYLINTRTKGAINDLYNGTPASSSGKVVDYRSPDFTTLGTADAAARDLILANLAWKHNSISNPSGNVHVAINLSQTNPGHTGAVTIANIITAGVGTRVLVGFNINGQADYLVISQDILNTLREIVAASTVVTSDASTIGVPVTTNFSALYVVPYLLPNTTAMPTSPANLHVAGTAGTLIRAQFMLFVCLDASKPIYQERDDFKTGLELGLTSGFIEFGASATKLTSPREPLGNSKKVYLDYREEQFRRYSEDAGRPYSYMHIEYPSEIVEGGWYDQVLIKYCNNPNTNGGHVSQHQRMVSIWIPNYTIGLTTVENPFFDFDGSGIDNAQRTELIALLNDFNTENRLGNPTLV